MPGDAVLKLADSRPGQFRRADNYIPEVAKYKRCGRFPAVTASPAQATAAKAPKGAGLACSSLCFY